MSRRLPLLLVLGAALVLAGHSVNAQTQIQIYGSWHCGNDFCTWGSVRDMTDFDTKNHWMIDRGDGSGLPSVNLVILSFVQPLKLLNKTTDSQTLNGVPLGMNSAVVSYFTAHNIRVMLSIGGITYTTYWDQALTQNATQLGLNAAALAKSLGVGIEIDYENSSSPNISGLQAFINAYRSQFPYDATRTSSPALRGRRRIGRSMLTASRNTIRRSGRWLRRSLREVCTSSPGAIRRLSVRTSAHRLRTVREPMLRPWRQTALGLPLECWAICSGRRSVRVRGQCVPHRRTPAKAEWEWEPEPITSRSPCRRCGKIRGCPGAP